MLKKSDFAEHSNWGSFPLCYFTHPPPPPLKTHIPMKYLVLDIAIGLSPTTPLFSLSLSQL